MVFSPPKLTEQIAAQIATALGDPTNPDRHRIAFAVRHAAKGAFSGQVVPRPTRILKELRENLGRLKSDNNYLPVISDYLGPYLLAPEKYQVDQLLKNREQLISAFESAVDMLETSASVELDSRGGRARDSRIHKFTISLSTIFNEFSNEPLTYTADKDTGNIVSKWGLFAYEAIHSFAPDEIVKHEGKIRTAIQETARFIRNTEPLDQAALDQMVPFKRLKPN